ncbi:MAG: DUF3857 domain-containing protein [Bacteroidetes Order II. Incertae sedis bacterium]|nr:DUF3857 domain-containing protein [Bacteroidetes Order II. bacterium]
MKTYPFIHWLTYSMGIVLFATLPLQAQAPKDHALIQRYEHTFEVINKGEAIEKIAKKIEVLNEIGAEMADLSIFHTKNKSLKSIKATLVGPDGKVVVKKLDQSNMQDFSGTIVNFYDDFRVRQVRLRHSAYPYTIAYEYEIRHTELFNYPAWFPQNPQTATVSSRFEFSYPINEVNPKFKQQNYSREPTISQNGNRKLLVWEQNEPLPALPKEPLSPSWADTAPAVIFSPDIFTFNGRYSGSLGSWHELGEWLTGLYQNRQTLSAEKVAFLKNLTKDEATLRGRAKKVYEHLQETTRYISIQLGIGGYQPFEAAYVEKKQYGDCKALANYLMSMLFAVEVPAYPVVIKAGEQEADIDPEFPINDFNHVILAIPDGDSFIWLEATSNTLPFGWLSDFTENRYALLLKSGESRLIRTPKTTASQNRQSIEAQITFDKTGNATQNVQLTASGNQAADLRSLLRGKSVKEFTEWFQAWSGIRAPKILASEFSSANNTDSLLHFSVKIESNGFINGTGTRIFLRPNAFNQRKFAPEKVQNRKTPVRLSYPYRDEDVIRYQMPSGYALEALPAPISISMDFGRYEARITTEENGFVYRRMIELYPYQMEPSAYEALRQFFQKVVHADATHVVLKKIGT